MLDVLDLKDYLKVFLLLQKLELFNLGFILLDSGVVLQDQVVHVATRATLRVELLNEVFQLRLLVCFVHLVLSYLVLHFLTNFPELLLLESSLLHHQGVLLAFLF